MIPIDPKGLVILRPAQYYANVGHDHLFGPTGELLPMRAIQPIHPFPARMAPEIALEELASLPPNSRVLDPMAGSGTVVRTALEQGHQAYGYDLDPLAVLMARVWTTPLDITSLCELGESLSAQARTKVHDPLLPWIDTDAETQAFISFWFGQEQRADLRVLSSLLLRIDGAVGDALRLALSRIIITKNAGASLARDVSHSRPHRARTSNDFPVFAEFDRSVKWLAKRLKSQQSLREASVAIGDARRLDALETGSIDAVITSPPYLNAIDYMRGHRLALVWMGFQLKELRVIRSAEIGVERVIGDTANQTLANHLRADMGPLDDLSNAQQRMINRYTLDLFEMVSEMHRVVRPGGKVVLVVGNSCLRGIFVRNAEAARAAAEYIGFRVTKRRERDLPPTRRYLPPPTDANASNLHKRMRTETVLTLVRP